MPEIFLPTADKQDSIKQTVEEIASNFPLDVSGGTDWAKYKDVLFYDTVNEIRLGISPTHPDQIQIDDEIFNLSGQGYITSAMIRFYNTGGTQFIPSGGVKLSMLVDGEEILDINIPQNITEINTSIFSVLDASFAKKTNGNLPNTLTLLESEKYSSKSRIAEISQPLFFKESIVVKRFISGRLKTISNTSNNYNNINCYVQLGGML